MRSANGGKYYPRGRGNKKGKNVKHKESRSHLAHVCECELRAKSTTSFVGNGENEVIDLEKEIKRTKA